jgi:hypothetical protein
MMSFLRVPPREPPDKAFYTLFECAGGDEIIDVSLLLVSEPSF